MIPFIGGFVYKYHVEILNNMIAIYFIQKRKSSNRKKISFYSCSFRLLEMNCAFFLRETGINLLLFYAYGAAGADLQNNAAVLAENAVHFLTIGFNIIVGDIGLHRAAESPAVYSPGTAP